MELIACAGEAAQPHTLEAMVDLQVRKAHFNLLALVTGFGELRRCHQRTGVIAGLLVQIACDLARRRLPTTLRLEGAKLAVALERTVAQNMVGTDAASGRKQLSRGTDIDVALIVELEVGAREGAVLSRALIPNRDVRRDTGLDQPTEELARAVGRVGDEALCLESRAYARSHPGKISCATAGVIRPPHVY